MDIYENKRILFGMCIVFFSAVLLSRCHMCYREDVKFVNSTKDTLFVGVSYYDNIDSVYYQLPRSYCLSKNKQLDTIGISLWPCINTFKEEYIYPDSVCLIDANYFLKDFGVCYFFLIKYGDAKKYTWDEICRNKLYRKLVVTRNKDGDFDRNIRY